MHRFVLILLLGLSATLPARAFTPESGFWWIPGEPGSGLSIEIQDNFLFLAGYTYDAQGVATFFTAQGSLIGNDRFVGTLTALEDGACIDCPWQAPSVRPDQGHIEILFDSEVDARLRWQTREVGIERFDFHLSPSGNQFSPFSEKMLGEWLANIDFSAARGEADLLAGSPYQGEFLVFNVLQTSDSGTTFFEGCRPDSSFDRSCSPFALINHWAYGSFDSERGRHVIFVLDASGPGAGSGCAGETYALYVLDVALNSFDGDVEFYCQGSSPTGQVTFPVRGFRSASRAAVQGSSRVVTKRAAQHGGVSAALPPNWEQQIGTTSHSDEERSWRIGMAARLQAHRLSRAKR